MTMLGKDQCVFDSLILPGQVVGEFELLGKPGSFQKLVCLSDNVVAFQMSSETVEKFKSAKFFENLSRSLMTKLLIQNSFFRVNDRNNVVHRLATLFCKFHDAEFLQKLITVDKEGYQINIKWSLEALSGSVSSQLQSVPEKLYILAQQKLIEVFLVNVNTGKDKNKLTSFEDFKALGLASCIRIKVLRHDNLHSRKYETKITTSEKKTLPKTNGKVNS
jgi:hypothetical protein